MTSCQSRFPCCRGPGSRLGQRRYLLSCITKRFTTSASFESNRQRSDMARKEMDYQITVNLLVTYVLRCAGSNAKTPRLKHQ